MPTTVGTIKAGRIVLAAFLGIVGMALVAGSADAQQSGRREALRTPAEKSFLDPGTASSGRRGPGYVVDGLLSTPAYGPSDRYGNNLLPPAIGGGYPLVGGNR